MNRACFLLTLAASFCVIALGRSHAADHPTTPEGVEWTLRDLGGKPVAASAEGRGAPRFQLDAEKKTVSGFSGVNRFFGGYERTGDQLKFGALAGTRMAGSPEAMEMEKTFLAALGRVTRWRLVEGQLELLADTQVVARFSVSHPVVPTPR